METLGVVYKSILNLGKELKHKYMNSRGREGAGPPSIQKGKAVPLPASNFQSQQ